MNADDTAAADNPKPEVTRVAGSAEEQPTQLGDAATEGETQSIHAWSLADDADTEITPFQHRSWKQSVAFAVAGVVAAVGVGVVVYKVNDTVDHVGGQRNLDEVVNPPTHKPSSAALPPASPSCLHLPTLTERVHCQVAANNAASATATPAAPPAPVAQPTPALPSPNPAFYGEWGNHFMSVTLAPDGTAHYAVSEGAMNTSSWSATWSPMRSDSAMVVLSSQLELHEASSDADLVLSRYPGQAFKFTLEPDGYATITDPKGEPRSLCPRGVGFSDTQGRCGA